MAGWAFNCSALHPPRWQCWKPWLEYMVRVLETDFDERQRQDTEVHESTGAPDPCDYALTRESLLLSYLRDCTNQMSLRSIIRALLADGSQSCTNLFPEVFDRENKPQAHAARKRRRQVLDLENDKFGDYFDDDSSTSSETDSSSKPASAGDARKGSRTALAAGLTESAPIRLRLWYLVCPLSCGNDARRFVD